jgi:hypothetical protein
MTIYWCQQPVRQVVQCRGIKIPLAEKAVKTIHARQGKPAVKRPLPYRGDRSRVTGWNGFCYIENCEFPKKSVVNRGKI